MSSSVNRNIASDKTINSSDCKTSYLVSLVASQGRISSTGRNLSTENLKSPSTPQNNATNSVISGITTPFLFNNIDPNHPSAKSSTQSQFPKSPPENSILFEGTNLMSSFNQKSFYNASLQSNSTQ